MSRDVQAMLFDFDGTVVDSYDLLVECFHYAVKQVLGVDYADEVLMQKVGQPLVVQMWDFTADERVHDDLCRVYREYNAIVHDARIKAFPHVAETLEALRASGLKTGIVTSKRHAPTIRGLEVFGLQGSFDCVVGSDDHHEHKPHPGPVVHAARLLGVDPSACAYVGDSPFDMQAGNGAGCLTVAATWGMFPECALRAERPDVVMGSFADLAAFASRN